MIRSALLFVLLGGTLLAGAGQLVRLELRDGQPLRDKARSQEDKEFTLPAVRGCVIDARGRYLASSVRRPCIYADPSELRGDVAFVVNAVAEIVGLDPRALEAELLRRRENGERYWRIRRQVTDEQAEAIRELRRQTGTQAFAVQMENWRDYPYGSLAAPLLGFVGTDGHGLSGIEYQFDDVLRGTDGRRRSTVDVALRRIRMLPDATVPAVDGGAVVLTIDATIQQYAEKHLREAFEELKPHWCTALVMDPWSGEVLASAVMPTFDPLDPFPDNLPKRVAEKRQINHAVSSQYEPGSIFKPFIVAAAYDAGLVSGGEIFEIDGPIRRLSYGRVLQDVKRLDRLTIWGILAHSSNIGMAMIGDRVGDEMLHEAISRFGFGQPTGVRLAGEARGSVSPLREWTQYSTHSVTFGQEVSVTPLQALTAFSALCNDGVLYRPRIVRGVLDSDGETLEDCSRPIPLRRVVEPETAAEIRRLGLRAVVTEGGGHRGEVPGWEVFGKTGTAQVAVRGGYHETEHASSFICGAPLSNPRVAVLVTIFRGKAEPDYGSWIAAPVASKIVADTLEYLEGPRSEEPADEQP